MIYIKFKLIYEQLYTSRKYHTMRILYTVLFWGVLAAFAKGETCPTPEEIEPCICDEDEFTGEIIVSCVDEPATLAELKKALNSLSQKNEVEIQLQGLNLGIVPSDFFYGIGVKRLDISLCELDSLSDGRPSLLGLEDTLEVN